MIEVTQLTNKFSRGSIVLIAGYVKSGKSTIISTWDDPKSVLALDFEGSMDHIPGQHRIRITSIVPPTRMDGNDIVIVPPIERGYYDADGNPTETYSFAEAMEYIINNWDKLGYKHIAIDTVDDFVELVNPIIVEELKEADALRKNPSYQHVTSINQFEFAQGHAVVRERVAEKILMLTDVVRKTGQVLLAAHLERSIRVGEGKNVIQRQKMSGVPDKLADLINGRAEAIIYVQKKEGNKYIASMDGYDEVSMGSRLPALQGKVYQFTKEGKHTLWRQIQNTLGSTPVKAPAEKLPDPPQELTIETSPVAEPIVDLPKEQDITIPEQPIPDAVKEVTRRFSGK